MKKEMPLKHLNITVIGRVQGVWFRKYTETKANELGIKGFVQNKANKNVYIEAEAEQIVLDSFIAWCHVGSPLASVKEVKWEEAELKHFSEFTILK